MEVKNVMQYSGEEYNMCWADGVVLFSNFREKAMTAIHYNGLKFFVPPSPRYIASTMHLYALESRERHLSCEI